MTMNVTYTWYRNSVRKSHCNYATLQIKYFKTGTCTGLIQHRHSTFLHLHRHHQNVYLFRERVQQHDSSNRTRHHHQQLCIQAINVDKLPVLAGSQVFNVLREKKLHNQINFNHITSTIVSSKPCPPIITIVPPKHIHPQSNCLSFVVIQSSHQNHNHPAYTIILQIQPSYQNHTNHHPV